ncbi:type II toxin-antitoxin system RelE/ParE family toxin [Microbulbifer harenosus]|uniref:type II toxin-antitoxin system RelE/ParE family toxin n=1 Tax=Microbulbifer harenosus TaxID=2576840 RepID=UPI002482BC74|nr:type II toxin-antitoxin system RelE/ParE family toxin [Microbulbifer harenosus]
MGWRKDRSGGVRTLLAYKVEDKTFFVYGFAKNARSNIKDDELKVLKLYAKNLLDYSYRDLAKAVKAGTLIEVKGNG